MTVTERAAPERVTPGTAARTEPRGFRPTSRRRSRIAAGVALAALAIGGNVVLYTSLDDTVEVLQLATDVRAGERVTSADLRVVEVDVDGSVPVVAAADLTTVVNRFARVFLPSGSLIHPGLVQPDPLIADGSGVVAVQVTPTRLPAGLTTRSQVLLVLLVGDERLTVPARVVRIGSAAGGDAGSLSVEVDVDQAPGVAAADDVRVVLIEPGTDAATEAGVAASGDG